jgi:C1A family cysteine protease
VFAPIAALEMNIAVRGQRRIRLSPQYLLSENVEGYNCNGGWPTPWYFKDAIGASESESGVVYESDYPYVHYKAEPSGPHSHHEKIDGWGYVEGEWNIASTGSIKAAIVQHGPVIAYMCSGSNLRNYRTGVIQTSDVCNSGSNIVNHAVVIFGWEPGVWLAQNSWGENWGEHGTFRIGAYISNIGFGAMYMDWTPTIYGYKVALPTISR